MVYNEGDLHRLLADESRDQPEHINMLEQALPREEAAMFEAEVHVIIANVLPFPLGQVPPVIQTACALAQGAFLLGLRAGCDMVLEARDELEGPLSD